MQFAVQQSQGQSNREYGHERQRNAPSCQLDFLDGRGHPVSDFMFAIAPPSHYEWQVPCDRREHLILHFDMNKTLIATDREGQKTAHDVIAAAIAERAIDSWDDSLEAPINYFQYVKYHLLPNPNHSKKTKFKQKEKIAEVLPFLKERGYPAYEEMQEIYDDAMRLLETQKTQIFPSFYRLIEFLHEKKISYTLVIRTFGSEAPEIAEELNGRFGSGFIADFRAIKKGNLQGEESDLYTMIVRADHHLAIRDDWEWWFHHGEHWEYGKPFPIDLHDSQYISLFFDDNAKCDPLRPQNNIVAPYDAVTGEPISPRELIEKDRLFPVEMLDALCDEGYYVRLVERVLLGIQRKLPTPQGF